MTTTEQGIRIDVVRHKVGTCPACHCGMWGEVRVRTLTGPPMLSVDGVKAIANTNSRVIGFTVEHSCEGDAA